MSDLKKLAEAGIDVNDGLERFCGRDEIYSKYLYGFVNDENFAALDAAVASGDAKAAFAAAHALKGVAGNLGIKQLYELLCPMVEIFRKGSMDGTAEMFTATKAAYEKVITALKE